MQKPNILVIMTDQQRFDSLGCYGCDCVDTPNIDRLAAEGARYTRCYVNNPVSTPSRASMLTGKHVNGHGVYQLHDILPETEPLLTEKLREKGYQTALIGKLHVSGRSYERDNRNKHDGFDIYKYAMTPHNLEGCYNSYGDWLRENHPDFHAELTEKGRAVGNIPADCHFTYWAAEETVDFISSRHGTAPFFCMMSVVDPHDPYSDYPLEALEGVHVDLIPQAVFEEDEAHRKSLEVERSHDESYLGGFHNYTSEDIQRMRVGYFASIAFLDRQVGRVLEALDRSGLRDSTMVVFISDHGDMLGDHELLAKGPFFYDASVRVPFIMRMPGRIPEGTVVEGLVQPHDLGATFLSLAGYSEEQISAWMPGSLNLSAALSGESGYHDAALCLYRNTGINSQKVYFDPPINATMLRTGEWKLTLYHQQVEKMEELKGELYNMEKDPGEKRNLWGNVEYRNIQLNLISYMMNWLVSTDAMYHSGRGGAMFPPRSQWSSNNPL